MGTAETILLIFSTIGILDTLYISYHATNDKPVKCWFFPEKWCNKVQYSKYNKTFGIPNCYLGLLLYAGIFLFTLFSMYTTMPFWPVESLAIIGFGFALYFTVKSNFFFC
jgi:uncharacterized membrane protein